MAHIENSESKPTVMEHVVEDINKGEINELLVIAEGEEKTTWFVYTLMSCACICGLLFGYDTGVISGALVTIGTDLDGQELSNGQKEFITSATTLGALIGGFTAGILSDKVGRRMVIFLSDVVFIGGSVAQAVCHTVWAMIGGRFLLGIGVGIASCMGPLYIQELSPTRLRGRLVVSHVVMITLGQVIAYGIGAAFYRVSGGWRWMVGLGAIPAAVQGAMLFFMPESPRILLKRGQKEKARAVLEKIYAHATPQDIDFKLQILDASVRQSIEITNKNPFFKRFISCFTDRGHRHALIIACGLQAFQQLSGFNTLMYYSATLFASVGFDNPTAVGLIVSGTNFVFTLVALRLIDQVGRRKIMLFSSPGMVVGLVLASIAFHFLTKSTGGDLIKGSNYPESWSAVVLFSMIIYVASYATGVGNVPWQQGELFALEVRGIGTSISTATNWAANLLIGSTYLSLMDEITPAGAFGFYAGLCFLGFIFVIFCFPETAGLSMEEVILIFGAKGFGIKESQRIRAEKNEIRRRAAVDNNSTDKKDGSEIAV